MYRAPHVAAVHRHPAWGSARWPCWCRPLHALGGARTIGSARAFFYSGAPVPHPVRAASRVATRRPREPQPARSHLLALVAAFTVLPLHAGGALPRGACRNTRFFDAWFEMVSSFTTTGATLLLGPGAAPPTVHLWRALVGWLGGLLRLGHGGRHPRAAEPRRVRGRFARAASGAEPSARRRSPASPDRPSGCGASRRSSCRSTRG